MLQQSGVCGLIIISMSLDDREFTGLRKKKTIMSKLEAPLGRRVP